MTDGNGKTKVEIFWTGGWDSSFRILQLCAMDTIEHILIQPRYIIDHDRKSHTIEIEAMDKMRALIYERYPKAAGSLLPTIFTSLNDIVPDPVIRDKHAQLVKRSHLGGQYYWLAEYAEQFGLNTLEISIAKNDGRAYEHISHIPGRFVPEQVGLIGNVMRLSSAIPDDDPISLFKYYHFPILDITKLEMKQYAEKAGFLDILSLSWFCFTPIDGKPCGLCNPCRCAIEEGMSFRLPKIALRRHRYRLFYKGFRKIKRTVKGFFAKK